LGVGKWEQDEGIYNDEDIYKLQAKKVIKDKAVLSALTIL
jgi:hypothetical protein